MENLKNAITVILVILFFGWVSLNTCCSEKKGCSEECVKSCCAEAQDEENTESGELQDGDTILYSVEGDSLGDSVLAAGEEIIVTWEE